MTESQTQNTELLERLKVLEAKYKKACDALEFVAFANPDIWKPIDRMTKALNALLDLGEIVKAGKSSNGGTHAPRKEKL